MKETVRMIIERLYCNCSTLEDSPIYNDYLALKSFATAIGGSVHTSERNMKYDILLKDYVDYLPYGKYQLRFRGAAKEYIDSIMETQIEKLKDVNVGIVHSNRLKPKQDEYFICKHCCPICKDSSRGCPIHCCTTCWKYLSIMSRININQKKRVIKNNKRRNAYTNSLNAIINSTEEFLDIKTSGSSGYFHSLYDLIHYLYLTYDYLEEDIIRVIRALKTIQ